MKDLHEDLKVINEGYILHDNPQKSVLYVIHKSPDYIIYEVRETGQITYKTSSEFVDNTYEIATQLDMVESFLGEDPVLWGEYKNTMADIYGLYLSDDPNKKNAAKKLLRRVANEIQYNKYNKVYYLLPCLVAVMVICLTALGLKAYNDLAPSNYYRVDQHILSLFYMMTFSSIGGLLSIAIYIDKHDQKFSRSIIQRTYAGLFRILISALSGLIIYILYRSNLLYIVSNNSNNFFIYALAITSGFSQNLVPNLANKSELIIIGKSEKETAVTKETDKSVTTANS